MITAGGAALHRVSTTDNAIAAGNGGYVNYIFGHHGSIIDPSCSTPPVGPDPLLCGATTMEMQQQTVVFAASGGTSIRVVNAAVIQPEEP